MNYRAYRIGLLAFILIFSIIFIALTNKKVPVKANIPPQFLYTVKEYNQKIGVFYYGENKPFEIVDVYIQTLPKDDITSLQNGINIADLQALTRLLEDYEY